MKHRTLDHTLHFSLAVGFASVVLAAFLSGCASQPDIRRDKEPGADLGAYKTFAFFPASPADSAHYTTLLSSHLKQATRAQLEKHHYVYSETNPDLRVNLSFNVIDKQELRSSPGAFHGYRTWSNRLETVEYRKGTLRIDLVDAGRLALVWQGVAEGRIDQKVLANPGASAGAVVAQIFDGFPNGPVKP